MRMNSLSDELVSAVVQLTLFEMSGLGGSVGLEQAVQSRWWWDGQGRVVGPVDQWDYCHSRARDTTTSVCLTVNTTHRQKLFSLIIYIYSLSFPENTKII